MTITRALTAKLTCRVLAALIAGLASMVLAMAGPSGQDRAEDSNAYRQTPPRRRRRPCPMAPSVRLGSS